MCAGREARRAATAAASTATLVRTGRSIAIGADQQAFHMAAFAR